MRRTSQNLPDIKDFEKSPVVTKNKHNTPNISNKQGKKAPRKGSEEIFESYKLPSGEIIKHINLQLFKVD